MLNQEELERKVAYHKALDESGKSFIKLKLLDMNRKSVYAVTKLEPKYGIGDHGLLKVDLFESSGPLIFEPNESNTEMVAEVLDCVENRNWLASHTAYRYWEIVDKQIRVEIQEIADQMTRDTVKNKKVFVPKESKMTDDEIGDEIARLQTEQNKRRLARKMVKQISAPIDEEFEQEEVDEENVKDDIPVQKPKKTRKRKKSNKKTKTVKEKITVPQLPETPEEEPEEESMVTVEG